MNSAATCGQIELPAPRMMPIRPGTLAARGERPGLVGLSFPSRQASHARWDQGQDALRHQASSRSWRTRPPLDRCPGLSASAIPSASLFRSDCASRSPLPAAELFALRCSDHADRALAALATDSAAAALPAPASGRIRSRCPFVPCIPRASRSSVPSPSPRIRSHPDSAKAPSKPVVREAHSSARSRLIRRPSRPVTLAWPTKYKRCRRCDAPAPAAQRSAAPTA